jgi:hypothetical protein
MAASVMKETRSHEDTAMFSYSGAGYLVIAGFQASGFSLTTNHVEQQYIRKRLSEVTKTNGASR